MNLILLEISWQPVLTYFGIGAAAIVGVVLVLWLGLVVVVGAATKGLPQAIVSFFRSLSADGIDATYDEKTTENFQASTSKSEFRQFIRDRKLHQFQQVKPGIPKPQANRYAIDVTVTTKDRKEVPLKLVFVKVNKIWKIDAMAPASISEENA
jgi:hypothetical protein